MKSKFDKACLNCLSKIESLEEVDGRVEYSGAAGLSQSEIAIWESRSSPVRLPQDMRAFYSEFNGFNIPWKVSLKDRAVGVGILSLNKLDHFTKMHTGIPTQYLTSLPFEVMGNSICYVIDTIPDVGDVVMSFSQKNELSSTSIPMSSPEGINSAAGVSGNSNGSGIGGATMGTLFGSTAIWFIDETNRQWSYICASFSDYMRLMIVHLGIIGWQGAFTPDGLSATTKEWMSAFVKERLAVDLFNFK